MADNNGKKMVHWVFDTDTIKVSNNSVQADREKRFSFHLIRYKDSNTYEESLKIECYLDGNNNGSILTDICNLEHDLKLFVRYGVVLSAIDFRDIRKVIEDNYLLLNAIPISLTDDTQLKNLLDAVKEYVQQDKHFLRGKLAFVPVRDFNGLAEDCGYSSYEMRALRSKLAENGYLCKQGDRYAGIVRLYSKPERVMSFNQDKLGLLDIKDGDTNE